MYYYHLHFYCNMKKLVLILIVVFPGINFYSQTVQNDIAYHFSAYPAGDSLVHERAYAARSGIADIELFLSVGKAGKMVLGYTKSKKPVEVYYFPGSSSKRALIIGGMHGSELSSIDLAKKLVQILSQGSQPFYNVLIIPCLFPDNADAASFAVGKNLVNLGRYSNEISADPNRQMPAFGQAFDPFAPYDSYGRVIENENQILLKLIQEYRPSRIVNLHAIRDLGKAGIFADPRTDCRGMALGFETDSSLAIMMASRIREGGGKAPGNFSGTLPTALYYHDPAIAASGSLQQRNTHGSQLPGNRGYGISLGGWAATAVCDGKNDREAIRLITVEFPGYKSFLYYSGEAEKLLYLKNLQLYAASIAEIFLGNLLVE